MARIRRVPATITASTASTAQLGGWVRGSSAADQTSPPQLAPALLVTVVAAAAAGVAPFSSSIARGDGGCCGLRIGLAAYRATGRIDWLFPGPQDREAPFARRP